jgi:circadian clock protein KaiC
MPDPLRQLPKAAIGIAGLDEILGGGLPQGRPTLVCGNAGCGKTLLAMEFLVRGATQFDEPGVFMAFEETESDLVQNVASLGFDLTDLITRKKLILDYVHIAREEIQETGEYDLEGLFIRLNHAIDSIGAKRVVLDTVETLFSGLPNPHILRAELRRLFRWLKDKGVTAVITGERGDGTLTRHGLEEYVSDCVILLDHRITEQISTRRLRVIKYRGSTHGTNEYPFLIDEHGISVMPITSLRLQHTVSRERISTGIPQLDAMMGGKGYYRGSAVMVSGDPGTGKSSIAAHFAEAAILRGERVLYLAFEESADQFMRNMRSIGIDLRSAEKKGLFQFEATRSSMYGLEMHLVKIYNSIKLFHPDIVIVDPINSFSSVEKGLEVKSMMIRLMDFLKSNGITSMFTNLINTGCQLEHIDFLVSSLIDTWLQLRHVETMCERDRYLYIVKSRGMAHSTHIRKFILTDQGIELLDSDQDQSTNCHPSRS